MAEEDDDVVLMADRRVTAIPVRDNGEGLINVRDHGLRVSTFRADATSDFAQVRTGLAVRLVRAAGKLPRGLHLLLVEGYRPPARQRRYFDDYFSSLRKAGVSSDEKALRMLTSRYVSPPEIAPHSAGAAIDLTLCADDGTELNLGTPVNATPEQSAGALLHQTSLRGRGSPAQPHHPRRGSAGSRARQLSDRVVALVVRRPVLGAGNGRPRRGLRHRLPSARAPGACQPPAVRAWTTRAGTPVTRHWPVM